MPMKIKDEKDGDAALGPAASNIYSRSVGHLPAAGSSSPSACACFPLVEEDGR